MKLNYVSTASFCVENARELGIPAALLLDKIVRLCKSSTRQDGFCWYTAKQFEDETSLKKDAFISASNKLLELGVIEKKITYIVGTKIKATHFRISHFQKVGQTEDLESRSNPLSVNTINNTINMPSADASGTSSKDEDESGLSSLPFDDNVIDVKPKQKERQTANAKAAIILRKFGEEIGIPTGGNRNKEVHRIKQLIDDGYTEEDILWVAKWSKGDEFYKDSAIMSRLSADAFDRAKLAKDKNDGGKIVRGFHL